MSCESHAALYQFDILITIFVITNEKLSDGQFKKFHRESYHIIEARGKIKLASRAEPSRLRTARGLPANCGGVDVVKQ